MSGPKSTFIQGGLADVEVCIAALLRAPSAVRLLSVRWTGQSDFVYVVSSCCGSLIAFIHSRLGHTQAIRSIFQEAGVEALSESIEGEESLAEALSESIKRGDSLSCLRYPLPPVANEAADLLREVLLRGCVAPERATFVFHIFGHANDGHDDIK